MLYIETEVRDMEDPDASIAKFGSVAEAVTYLGKHRMHAVVVLARGEQVAVYRQSAVFNEFFYKILSSGKEYGGCFTAQEAVSLATIVSTDSAKFRKPAVSYEHTNSYLKR